jgi:lipid-binding SYLF domain-containing protein
MHKKNIFITVLITLLIFTSLINAQWVQTNGPYGGYICSLTSFQNSNGGTTLLAGVGALGAFLSNDNGLSWTQTSLNWGYIYSFVVSPNSNGGMEIFAAIPGGGVFLSIDEGITWKEVNTGLTDLTVVPLAVSGTNLFAGTFSGVFRSTNNGSSWTQVNTSLTNIQTFIVCSNGNGGTNLFAGTYGNGVFVSTDNGSTWTQTSLKNTYVQSFAILPNGDGGSYIFAGNNNQGGIYFSSDNGVSWYQANTGLLALCVSSLVVSGTNIFAGTASGVFLSTNKGSSWSQVNNGLTNTDIRSIAISTDNNGSTYLYAGTYGNGVFYSTNNGALWNHGDKGIPDTFPQALAIAGNSNIIAGTLYGGIFLSTDNGSNWTQTNLKDESILSLATSATENGNINLFAGTYDFGVFRSTDNGSNWIQTGLSGTYVYSLATSSDGTGINKIYAGTKSDGVFYSTDNGISWECIGLKNNFVSALAIAGKNLFCGTYHDSTYNGNNYLRGSVFMSSDNGINWTPINNGLNHNQYISSFAVLDTCVFAVNGGNGVYRWIDNGTNWKHVDGGLLPNVSFITVVGTNLFAGGGYGKGVFLSTDNGTSWSQVGLNNSTIYAFAATGTNLFACDYYGYIWRRPLSEMISSIWQDSITVKDNSNTSQSLKFGRSPSATDGIDASLGESPLPPAPFGFDARFHLPTGDDSWTDIRSSAKDTVKWVMKFQPGSGGYPITFSWDKTALPKGKFTLTDAITGTVVNVDMTASNSYTLTNTGINSLIIQYISPSTPTSVKNITTEIPTVFSLMQNYPNPFNPTTVIKYGLPGNSNVKLKIYNVLGQLVESLVNGLQQAGFHEVTWNASNKASGIYLCSIEAVSADGKGNFHSVKKLLLLK